MRWGNALIRSLDGSSRLRGAPRALVPSECSSPLSFDECIFYLESLVVDSLSNRFTFCLDYGRMKGLEPIGAALYAALLPLFELL